MKKHEILSPQSRAMLFDAPPDPISIVRHCTLSPDDLVLIRRRRRDPNRLGFAVHLVYLRFPGRVLGLTETPPSDMVRFIGEQLGIRPEAFVEYARREETRWEHLRELYHYLGVRPFARSDYRPTAKVAFHEATGTDRGDAIVAGTVAFLRQRNILLPAATVLERIALTARAMARKQAHKTLIADLTGDQRQALEALLSVIDAKGRTPLAWLREWSEAPTQKNLGTLIERLANIRALDIGADREQRIHRARYMAIARETAIVSAQHLSRFDDRRRLATLVVFVREMEAILTDAGIVMFDKMMGSMFRRADHKHKERVVDRTKVLDASVRTLLGLAKALLAAREGQLDHAAAVEQAIGWDRLADVVKETDEVLIDTRQDSLAEVVGSYPTVHRISRIILGAFTFRSWKASDPLLTALDKLREIHQLEWPGKSGEPSDKIPAIRRPAWHE